MKTPIIKIFSSSSKDMTHYIFRSKDKSIDKTIEEFVNKQTPVGMINEKDDTDFLKTIQLKNVTMSIEENPRSNYDFNALSLPFEFCIAGKNFDIEIKNSIHADEFTVYKFYIGVNTIFKIEKTSNGNTEIITDQDYISKNFKLNENKNCILINRGLFNHCVASFTGDVEVYYYYDDGKKSDAECNPSASHGVYKPVINMIDAQDYIAFYQEAESRKNVYFYNVVSKLSDGTISEISNTQSCEIAEPADTIEYKLQSTDLYYTKEELEEDDWKDVGKTKATPLDEIRVAKKDLVSNIIPTENFKIYANDDNLRLQNLRELKITNIWNVENRKLMLRDKKTFRAVNTCGDIVQIGDTITFKDRQEIMIDKILILKKNVTEEANPAEPIALNDKKAETLKIFVRQGGIYYKDFFLNNNNTNDYDEPVPHYIVSAVTLDSRFPMLITKDDCIFGNRYNYTVYLYDELGKTSDPISVVL